MRPADNIEKLIKKLRYKSSDQRREKVLDNVLEALEKIEEQKPVVRKPDIWRDIMKSRITRLAAAAVIIIAVLVGIHYFAGEGTETCWAWECLIEPIMNAQTAELDIIVGEEGEVPVIHDLIKGSRIRRTVAGVDEVSIIDLATMKILSLSHDEKQAVYIDLKGLPQIPNYIETLQSVLTMLQDSPHFVVEELGEQVIDGVAVHGFRAKHPAVELTLWADAETALPVRIEQQQGQMNIICKNIEFDVEMDDSLFSMEVPEGYTSQETEMDLLGATEQDFIEGLRVYAEVLGDGAFPEDVSVEYYIKQAAWMEEKFKQMELSDEENMALGMKLNKSLLFIRFFKGQGKWYYAGDGVTLGDAQTPIFWYRPAESETYRVIYGDLHAEDVAEADLPEPIEAEAKKVIGYQQWDKDEFVGRQEDQWHITENGEIEAHSTVRLIKGPEGVSAMSIKLPYDDAILESVTLEDIQLAFEQVSSGQYKVELPLEKLIAGRTKIEFVWTLPLEELKQNDGSYSTVLNSLIPVGYYKLMIVLEDNCGYVYSNDASQREFEAFKWGGDSSDSYFGFCDLAIRPEGQQ